MNKATAHQLCLDLGIQIDDANYTFASQNTHPLAQAYWANPSAERLAHNWWLILNDRDQEKLHVFCVPAHSLSIGQFSVRQDNGLLNISIGYGDSQFTDRRGERVSFRPYLVRTIPYPA